MIVGTAGHIDHGKTLLVRALTGVDTDRLKEEKARGITIELGFAYVPIEGGDVLGFVDVPGHERFVHTMLAGAAGIDFLLLVVAADDGVKPQTREHLAIVDLLGIRAGVVALTKIDLVDDARQHAAEAEVRAVLGGTRFAEADLYPVSAATGEGIPPLRQRLEDEARSRPRLARGGTFRLAIDRSFTLQGTGTVVTGTAISGSVAVGDTVTVLPQGIPATVRSIHAQNQPVERGMAGQRCALNLSGSGISRNAIKRGDWLADPSRTMLTDRLDAKVTLLLARGGHCEAGIRSFFISERAGRPRASCHYRPMPSRRAAVPSRKSFCRRNCLLVTAIALFCATSARNRPLVAVPWSTPTRPRVADGRRSGCRCSKLSLCLIAQRHSPPCWPFHPSWSILRHSPMRGR